MATHCGIYAAGVKFISTNNNTCVGFSSFCTFTSVIGPVDFGAMGSNGGHIWAGGAPAAFYCSEAYTISGGAYNHVSVEEGSFIDWDAGTAITLTGTPAFTIFALAYTGANIVFNGTFTGSATGRRYAIGGSFTSTASFGSGGAYITSVSDFPGNAAGTISGGGSYNGNTLHNLLTADTTFYVRTDGNDNNDGRTDSAGGAFLTWQAAYDYVINNINSRGYAVTIQQGAQGGVRTYSSGINLYAPLQGDGPLWIIGDTATPTNVVINSTPTCFNVTGGGTIYITGFKLISGNYGVGVLANASVWVQEMNYGACTAAHISAGGSGSNVYVSGLFFAPLAYTISGNSAYHYLTDGLSNLTVFDATVTLTGTPAFTAFANSTELAILFAQGSTFTGGSTGKRYDCTVTGLINTFGGGANYFPGDAVGTTATQGLYL
jgi:hypothetical protein